MKYALSVMLLSISAFFLTLAVPSLNDSALAQQENRRELANSPDNSKALANQFLQQGIEHYQAHQLEVAFRSWQQALKIYREIGDHQSETRVLAYLGAVYGILGDYQQALKHLLPALTQTRELNDRQQEYEILGNLGFIYDKIGKYDKVIESGQRRLILAREFKYDQGEAQALSELGQAYQKLGNFAQAIKFYQQHLNLARGQGDSLAEASALGNLGLNYYHLDDYTRAIAHHQQSLTLARQISALNQGESRKVARQIEANALSNLGIVQRALGQFIEAIAAQEQALIINQELENRQNVGEILNCLGNAYAAIGYYKKALTYQQQSLVIARETRHRQAEEIALVNLGSTYANLDRFDEAVTSYELSLEIAQELKDRRTQGSVLTNLGIAYHALRNPSRAIQYYQKSLNLTQEIGDRKLSANALAGLALAYDSLQNYSQAIEFHEQALRIYRSLKIPQEEAMVLNNLAHTLLGVENFSAAEQHLRQAIAILDSLRNSNQLADASYVSLFDTQVFTYNLLQQVLIAQQQPEQALQMSEHGRNRAFVALLTKRFSSNIEAFPASTPPTIEQIKQIAQARKATLIEYSIIPEDSYIHQGKLRGRAGKLYIWVVQPTGQVAFRPVDLQSKNISLEEIVTKARKSDIGVAPRGGLGAARGNAEDSSERLDFQELQNLHKLLIDPIADLLPSDPEQPVIFIPHQELFFVPFAALQDNESKYLIEKHTIVIAPSIQSLELTHQLKANRRSSSGQALVVGNPTMPIIPLTDPPKPLQPLPNSETEARKIAEKLSTQPILGDQATKANILPQMQKAGLIHFATHGLLDDFKQLGTPGAIALAPTDEKSDPYSGFLTSGEIIDLKLQADLVVLSACNTGQGHITGDGVIGLSRALIAAGTPSVVVSLWSVPDASTADLMIEFYTNLYQKKLNKAQALRQAMLTMKDSEPINWAGFILIGETN